MAISFNHFNQIADALPEVCREIVKATAKRCVHNIQGFILSNGQVDTEFMISNIYYTAADGESTYGEGKAPPLKGAYRLPQAFPPDQMSAMVGAAANYSIFQNYGTRFMPGRPFFEPGIEQTRPGFEAKLASIESRLPH